MSEFNCTWQDPPDKRCENLGMHEEVDKDGKIWANLCQEHHQELEYAIDKDPFDIPLMLRCWVRAGGGAKKMAGWMVRGKA